LWAKYAAKFPKAAVTNTKVEQIQNGPYLKRDISGFTPSSDSRTLFDHKMLTFTILWVDIPQTEGMIPKTKMTTQGSCYNVWKTEGLHVRVVAGLLNKITLVREKGILYSFQYIDCVHIEVWPISYDIEIALPSLRSISTPSLTSLSWL
jgi:hypothetical protein